MTYIFHANESAVGAFQDDVVEFGGLDQLSHGADADLKSLPFGSGRLTDLARGDLNVLLLKRADNVGGRKTARGQAGRIQPKPHGILALTENSDIGNTGDALDGVADVDVDIVADEQAAVLIVIGIKGSGENETAEALSNCHAGVDDFSREQTESGLNAVLHVDRGKIRVARNIKGSRYCTQAIIAAGGGEVFQPFDAVNRALERNRDSGLDRLGVSSVVGARDGDLGRSEIRELRDRERGNSHGATENDDQRANSGEDRSFDEEINEQSPSLPSAMRDFCDSREAFSQCLGQWEAASGGEFRTVSFTGSPSARN